MGPHLTETLNEMNMCRHCGPRRHSVSISSNSSNVPQCHQKTKHASVVWQTSLTVWHTSLTHGQTKQSRDEPWNWSTEVTSMTFRERYIQSPHWRSGAAWSTNGTIVHEPTEPNQLLARSNPGQVQQWRFICKLQAQTISGTLDSNWPLQK